MITWKEQREMLLHMANNDYRGVSAEAEAIRAALARLDAAETALDEARTSFDRTHTRLSYDAEQAYDVLCEKQDGKRR